MKTFECLAGEDLGTDFDRYLGYRELHVRADGMVCLDEEEIDPLTTDVLRRGTGYGRSEKIDAAYEHAKLSAAARYGQIAHELPAGAKVTFFGWEITKSDKKRHYYSPSYF